ncbi:unnamed protein product [Paramecium sonneborni]|uniref:Uncharacterized protein n=1 Tax=Paramecium sonneborni TaxID=65129 RepID=A0A8S1LTY3_9CILI|nr:unnamed protein product [Paramecium sonneborni]
MQYFVIELYLITIIYQSKWIEYKCSLKKMQIQKCQLISFIDSNSTQQKESLFCFEEFSKKNQYELEMIAKKREV